jgi:hypothetical protein
MLSGQTMTPCIQGMHYIMEWNIVYEMWIYCA